MMVRQVTPSQDRSADIAAEEEALAHLQERIISAREPPPWGSSRRPRASSYDVVRD